MDCAYCNKTYKVKENYDKHLVCCEFFFRARNTTDSDDPLPSQRQLFRIIQELAVKCSNLEKDMAILKNANTSRTKREVMDILRTTHVPAMPFDAWIKAFVVEISHLEDVYKYDLTFGIKSCMKATLNTDSPICAFLRKPNKFYIYQGEWRIVTPDEFDKMIQNLCHLFLRKFNNDQLAKFENSDKELMIINMIKINGGLNTNGEQRRRDIRKWLFTQIAV